MLPTLAERSRHRQYWTELGVPYGYCLCGCGRQTSVAGHTDRRLSRIKDEPTRYIRGHATTRKQLYTVDDRGYRTPCWIVTGWVTHDGYGQIVDGKGRQRLAHIVMWERIRGPVPPGLQLDHLCYQPPCIRPDHLEPVTNAENARRARTTKLCWDDVHAIRRAIAAGTVTYRGLAKQYGVCLSTIGHIATYRNWRED